MLLTTDLGRTHELPFGGIAMLNRLFAILVIPVFACGILSAQVVSPDHLRQPTLTPQNSGTTNGLISVLPVNQQDVWSCGSAGQFTVTTDGWQTRTDGVNLVT